MPLSSVLSVCVGFIYTDWIDKACSLNDTTTVDIDPTKYYIKSSPHSTESSAHVDYDSNENSASFSTHNSSSQDLLSSRRPRRIAYSARNVADDKARDNSFSDNRSRSSTYLEAWHSSGRCRVGGVPPTSRRSTQSTETLEDIALSDLNLTNSMTSLIQSGSASAHAWSSMLASNTCVVQPEARKPPSGNRQGRIMKRKTRQLESDDQQAAVSSRPNNRVLQRLTCADVFPAVTSSATSAKINLRQRSVSSSVFPPARGTAQDHVIATPRQLTNGILRRPMSVSDVPRRNHEAPTPSVRDSRNQLRLSLFCPPERLVNGSVPSVTPRRRPVIQDPRRCTSNTDFKSTSSQSKSPATTGSEEQDMTVETHPAIGLHVNMISKRQKAIQRAKAVSLVQVTSTAQTDPAPQKSRLSASVWDGRDVIKMTDAAVGVTCSHDSLSDEGYQTKDSASMSSLNRIKQSSVRGCQRLYPVYV